VAQAAAYLSLAPKSNAVLYGYGRDRGPGEHAHGAGALHLRNAPTGLMKNIGYRKDISTRHDQGEKKASTKKKGADSLPAGIARGQDLLSPHRSGFEALCGNGEKRFG